MGALTFPEGPARLFHLILQHNCLLLQLLVHLQLGLISGLPFTVYKIKYKRTMHIYLVITGTQ